MTETSSPILKLTQSICKLFNSIASAKVVTKKSMHFERALALSPNDFYTLGVAAILNDALGKQETAIPLAEYFVSRNPMDPGSYIGLGVAYQEAGRYDNAIASFRTALRLSPAMTGAHGRIGDTLFLKGDYEGALKAFESESQEAFRLSGLSSTYYFMGNRPASDAALAELIAKYSHWASVIAIVFALRGDRDQAFEWLERAVSVRDSGLISVSTTVRLRNLQDDPRWLTFLRKMGRAPEQLAAIKFDVQAQR